MLILRIVTLLKRCYWRFLVSLKDIWSTFEGWVGDVRLRIDTGFYNDKLEQGIHFDSREYEPTRYKTIQKILNALELNKEDVFVDYGCGKGRVVFVVAMKKIKKVIGLEIDKKMLQIANSNLKNFNKNLSPVELIDIDAANFDPKEGTILFMFNPFGEKTMINVIEEIKKSLKTYPRKIRIVYHNPKLENILKDQNWLVIDKEINSIFPKVTIWASKYSEVR